MKSLTVILISILASNFLCVKAQGIYENKIWNVSQVDSIPQFPGGEVALASFMEENLVTPPDNGGCGGTRYAKVITGFVVNADGSIHNISIVDSAGPLYNQEAVFLVQALPNFKPGYKTGKPVNVYFNLPVIFGRKKTELGY